MAFYKGTRMLIWSLAFISCIQHALMIESSSKEVKAENGLRDNIEDSSAKSYSFLVDVVNTAGKIGETVDLFAQALKSADPDSEHVGWEYYPGQTVQIWSENNPDYIVDADKFSHVLTDHGDNTFDYNLTLTADATMHGPYQAQFLLNGNVKTQAYVVVLDDLDCPPTGDVKDEGELITMSCDTYFYGYKSPVLKWFVDDSEIHGNVIVVDNRVISTINITAAVDQDEVTYSCRLMFEQGEGEPAPPTYQDQCTTFYYVNHPVNNVTFVPNPEDAPGEVLQMSIGEYINCSAGGRPEPLYTWGCDDGQIIQGASLLMTESFVREGGASVMCTCEAENVVNGFPYSAERDVHFVVNNAEEGVFIGFTAWKSTTQDLSEGETVIYEEVIINEGGHYRPLTGRFQCPVRGIYFAYTTGKAEDTSFIAAEIVNNSEICAHIIDTGGKQNTVTNSCLMECAAGEYIAVLASITMSVYGDSSVPYSSFSVILMRQLGEELLHQGFDGSSAAMDGAQSFNQGDTVTFPIIMHNNGSYLPSTSEYTCREDGIYFVMVTLMKQVSDPLYAAVEHHSQIVLSLIDDVSSNQFNQISNSVLLSCTSGETIAVKATSDTDINASNADNKYTTFSVMFMGQEGSKHPSSFLGCSVWISSTQYYAINDTIEYNEIALNIGGHFDPTTSQFICPSEAVYYITATATKTSTSDLQINIMHETTTLFRLEDLGGANPENTVSNSALVRCSAQEVIGVKAAGSGVIYGSTAGVFSTLNVMKMN